MNLTNEAGGYEDKEVLRIAHMTAEKAGELIQNAVSNTTDPHA